MENEIIALKQKVETIAAGQNEMKFALKDIAASLKSLTRLEVEHNESQSAIRRAFTRIDDHEKRIRSVEGDMPSIKIATGWVFKVVLGVLGVLGTLALVVVFRGGV